MTGQVQFSSYEDSGAVVSVALVNELATGYAFGRPVRHVDPFATIRRILEIDPPSAARLREQDVPGFVVLAKRLREVFQDLDRGDLDAAGGRLNELLAIHPAYPHLAKEGGLWRLHHHPVGAPLVPMATAICAEGMARVLGAGAAGRLGTCNSDGCDRVFLDGSKNASRRFCSTTCQNRVKAAAFRQRHIHAPGRVQRASHDPPEPT